ncbi:head GIN domain-containing protein [uncultured Massilia sp.]|uniref:head GIN domain-containing protein n=1 Tax=uncultured Massilia sp. TaxID=169973 RepID=UPI0025FE7751|nr:head GIN domain-containing protein [uncultured Massilia sp.]
MTTNTSAIPTAIPTARRRFLAGACALACVAAAPQAGAWGWGSETVEGRGPVRRQERSVGRFDGLSVAVPGTVEVRTGNAEGVTIETEDNLLPLIETVVEDRTLKIRARSRTNLRTRNLRIVVQVRELDRMTLAGSANVDIDAMRGQRVRFDIGGSGEIRVRRVEGGDLSVNLGGSGKLQAGDGSARKLSVSVAGSGNVDLGKVRTDTASVNVAGSGNARLWVRDALSLTVAGSGDVDYYGDPQVSKSVVGSGSLRRLGSAP